MSQHADTLDEIFVALSDPTRRQVVRHLGRGPASVGELARPHPITLPSFMKHVRTLESCGLIQTEKSGRVRMCTLDRSRLAVLDDWLSDQRRLRDDRTDRLEDLVTHLEETP